MRSIIIFLIIFLLGALSLLPQSQGVIYPPEGQPITPSIQILWMTLPVPDIVNPVKDESQVVDKLIIVTFADYPTQALADGACQAIIANDNLTLSGDPANISRNRLAGCVRVDYTAVNGDADFAWIARGGAGNALAVQYQNQYGADIFQFVTRSNNYCGLGIEDVWRYGVLWAYSWVSIQCIVSNFSNIHEEGHNRGANHDIPNANSSFYAWAHGFCDSAHGMRDVMTYSGPCGGSRGPFFSNPNISPYGSPFGDAATMDNARVIRDTATIMAGLKSLPTILNHLR